MNWWRITRGTDPLLDVLIAVVWLVILAVMLTVLIEGRMW